MSSALCFNLDQSKILPSDTRIKNPSKSVLTSMIGLNHVAKRQTDEQQKDSTAASQSALD